jgi:DNA topoisomerase-1
LQQEANRKLGFTARITMSVAQSLYENGYITYMRTDSTNLSGEAIRAARTHIEQEYGKEYLPSSPRFYQSKEKNAQEAHEAIRPAGSVFDKPESLRSKLSNDQVKLYEMIWKRTVACQMTDARVKRKTILLGLDDAQFSISGKTIEFAGYLRAYVEGSDDPDAELADRETVLPDVKADDVLQTEKLIPKQHTTQPPGRFTEASLTKTLTDKGIGRPSTYASIIETILNRNYVFKSKGALIPTWTAIAVTRLLETHLPDLIDYDFTAQMEDQLDAVSRGELNSLNYLTEFYHGGEHLGLRKELDHKAEEIDPRVVCSVPIPVPDDIPAGTEPIIVRVGKYGPFLQQGEKNGNIPDELPPDEMTYPKATELLNAAAKSEKPLGTDPETGKSVYFKAGRFGPYVQLGETDDEEKKNASLLKGMSSDDVDLETALKLLSLPRKLGEKDGTDVMASNGKFGPYIFCGKETRSLPADVSPLDVSLEKALELLSQPKYGGRRKASAKKEPLRVFDVSPVTEKPIQVLSGFYGTYVTDGTTNATLPKGTIIEDLTFDEVLTMLADKAARGPVKKFVRKKAAKKVVRKKKG